MAITITGTQQKAAWLDKTMPPAEQVRPLVWSVPIRFADNPVRYTLSYLLANESGECVVMDPGWDSAEGRAQLTDGLALAGLTLASVVGIVSTHLHPDHLGMVRYLAEATGAWVAMHPVEARALERMTHHPHDDEETLDRWGVPSSIHESLSVSPRMLEYIAQLARPTVLLDDGDLVPLPGRDLRVIATPGHTPGHICIADVDNALIFTGDHILPRITPNVGIGSPRDNRLALRHYYDSLELMPAWDDFEVCPAHEYRFRGLAERARDLRAHHLERSQEIVDALSAAPTLTVWQIAQRLTWSRGWNSLDGINLRSALSETSTHIEYLTSVGTLTWAGRDVALVPRSS